MRLTDFFEMLGHKYKDKITGYVGVVDSLCFDLYGCIQVSMRPASLNEKGEIVEGRWFDVSRLDKLNEPRLMEVPAFSKFAMEAGKHPPGPADKPTRRG